MVDTLYVVMCGSTQHQLDELASEDQAVQRALEHDRYHHCTPWVQYPLEHVHRDES
jgi:hypothetical protein